jgi:two-component system, cell cycle sensor histidine kinase and response regulator CckA
VLEAADGAGALALIDVEPVDLLFTDVVMPGGIDGVQLARLAVERRPDMKVLLTSGFPQTKLAERFEPSSFRLLTKPYRKVELAKELREVLDGRALDIEP